MPNDETSTAGQNSTRIDVSEDDQLRDWAKKLDSSPDQIREAVKAVGDQAADVEMHLKGSRSTTNADQEARGDAS